MTYEEARKVIADRSGTPREDDWDLAEAAAIMMGEVDRYTQLPASRLEEELCQTRANLDEAHLIIEKKNEHINDLKMLVKHCWIHSGYRNCGYNQMTYEQQKLYDKITMECSE